MFEGRGDERECDEAFGPVVCLVFVEFGFVLALDEMVSDDDDFAYEFDDDDDDDDDDVYD